MQLAGGEAAGIEAIGTAAEMPPEKGRKLPLVALGVLCTVAFAMMEYLALNQWLTGRWYLADVGNLQYCMVNTWGGNFMHSPLDQGNFFAFHFVPWLFILMPMVWLSPYPIPLVTAYQLALALTPVPIYMLARQRGLPAAVAIAAGIWFLGNHFTGSLQLANHFESFYVLFALSTMAAMCSPRRGVFWTCAVLALAAKEDCAVWLLGYAVWEWLFHRDQPLVRQRALRLGILCLAWGVLAFVVMKIAAIGETNDAGKYVDRMGGISIGRDNTLVFLTLLASSGGLCLLNWRAALLLLIPIPVILGNFYFTRNLMYYYSYPFLPFLAFATVAGVARLYTFLRQKWPAGHITAGVIALLLAGIGIIQYPMPTRTDELRRFPQPVLPRDDMRRQIARTELPPDVPMALQSNLWGVTPWRFHNVLLMDSQLEDKHGVFMDFNGLQGLAPGEYEKVLARLRDEVDSGRRKELYNRFNFVVLSPATAEGARPQ